MRTIAIIQGASISEETGGLVHFMADADIDADGANGQHGEKAAYMVGDHGSELLVNGGMKMEGGKVVGNSSWYRDIVILENGQPKEFPGGIIASKTSYRFHGAYPDSPSAYVDAETVPYIVVPPAIISGVAGAVLGCRARVTYKGKSVDALVADVGPRTKVGELSIAAARAVGIPSSPRNGGISEFHVLYELWPGIPAEVNGVKHQLQRANGTYV